jgi:RHS repeat-associated protein
MRIGIVTGQTGPENKYKFGSKEMQDEFGLNEYDFGARFYDPAIGRWGCVDPMADMAPDWTPFRYGFNNPLRYTDEFEGGEWADKRKEGDKGKSARDGSSQTFTGSVVQPESGLTPIKVDPIKAEQMQMIQIMNLDVSKLSPELRAMNQAPTRQDKLEVEEPETADYLAGAGSFMIDRGDVVQGIATNVGYGMVNSATISWNWIVHREMKGLQGYTIGRSEAQNASFMSALSILSLPLGGLGELMGAGSNLWKVGPYNKIAGIEHGLDAHHVGQKAMMMKLIPNYNWRTAPSILVPKNGHTLGSGVLSRNTSRITTVRQLIARDIKELRRVYSGISNNALQELIQLNKTMYPSAFIK